MNCQSKSNETQKPRGCRCVPGLCLSCDAGQSARVRVKARSHSPQDTGNNGSSKRNPVTTASCGFLGGGSLTILLSQGLVDEVCGPFEVGAKVELLRVVGLDAQVGDAGVLVEAGVGVDVHEGPALGGVQDVGDAQFLQLGDVLSHRPGQGTAAGGAELTNWQPQREEDGEDSKPLGRVRSPPSSGPDQSFSLSDGPFPTPAISDYQQLPQIARAGSCPSCSLCLECPSPWPCTLSFFTPFAAFADFLHCTWQHAPRAVVVVYRMCSGAGLDPALPLTRKR